MSWMLQITGHAADAIEGGAADAERKVADAFSALARALTDAGHEGVSAEFTGENIGTVNLLAEPAPAPTDTADALGGNTPQPPAPGETQPEGAAVADGTPAPLPVETTEGAGAAETAAGEGTAALTP